MAVSLCQPYRGSKRYKQMVDYYQWKLERRYERSMTYKSTAFCHDALVWWTVLYQLLRLAQLTESMMSGMR
ncbi:hypothetical protein OEZ85_005019 [Tetradesmus obliquus]|uniref:Uncharacterized protein n=1 Tax=Tetradesmus obliquus TaxID=3088 RepID=A0ABY8UGZ8_TETOB|nr:hypothetical protein OEZ85_005019 [Tetradesmus obliquus]